MARTRLGFEVVKTLDGGPLPIKNLPLVSGTYYEGQVLRVSLTSGSGTKAAAAGTSIAGVLTCNVTTTNSSSGEYPVVLGMPNVLFKAKMAESQTPWAKIGDLCDLAVSGNTMALQGTASTNVFSIVGFADFKFDNKTEVTPRTAQTGVPFYVKFARSLFAQTKSDVTK